MNPLTETLYRNQPTDLHSKWIAWFQFDGEMKTVIVANDSILDLWQVFENGSALER